MKNSLYFFILFFKVNFIFAQYGPNGDCAKSGCNGENEVLRCWGSIKYFESNTIQVRVKGPIANCFNAINDEPRNSYVWHIEVSGTPQSDFKLLIVDALGTERNIAYFKGTTLKKLVTDIHTFSNAEIINISVTDIKISSNNSSNQTNNTTTSTGQQNDLTEYNRSKADLERQMAERNQETANKRQQYLNAFNAGVNAHNSGNYAEAKTQFNTALNYATTSEERTKAQEYLNKSAKTNRDIEKINSVGTGIQETLTGIDAILKANREQKRLQAEEEEKKREEQRQQQLIQEQKQSIINKEAAIKEAEKQAALYEILNYNQANKDYFINVAGKLENPEMKLYVDYIVRKCQKAGYNFKNITKNCIEDVSDHISRKCEFYFSDNEQKNLKVSVTFFYSTKNWSSIAFDRRLLFKIDKGVINNIDLYEIAGERNIGGSESYSTSLSPDVVPKSTPESFFKNTSYKGFSKESEYKKESTIESYLYNAELCDCKENMNSLNWYNNAIRLGDKSSYRKLAEKYESEFKDYDQATEYYIKDFEVKNDFLIAYKIGDIFETKLHDYANAIKWYSIVFDMIGDYKYCNMIAYIYAKQMPIEKRDYNEAKKWYLKAAEKGNASAMDNLGYLYSIGGYNLEKNKSESKRWYKLACKTESKYCKK